MFGVLLAERAILFENQSVGIVLLVLDAVIVSMLAFRAFECNFGPCRDVYKRQAIRRRREIRHAAIKSPRIITPVSGRRFRATTSI